MNTIASFKTHIEGVFREACRIVFGNEPKDMHAIYPPNVSFGDFSIPCFLLGPYIAKWYIKNPAKYEPLFSEIFLSQEGLTAAHAQDVETLGKELSKTAARIAALVNHHLAEDALIEKIDSVGQYLNFTIRRADLFGNTCKEILDAGNSFGTSDIGRRNQRVMVEYLSPNTNKPLHLGHLRNGALGMALANLLEARGETVIKANLINDRGVHICKSMRAWQKWGNGATPASTGQKGDHFVGQWYVRYAKEALSNPSLEEEVRALLQKWEAGDEDTLRLWRMMNEWVYDGFAQTYKKFGLKFDIFYYESITYKLGKDIVAEGVKKGVFTQAENGAIVAVLPQDEFGVDENNEPKKVTLLREDGTSVYITQDLGTVKLKFDEHKLDRSIYVVGSEQEFHFKCLFALLKMLEFPWAAECYHLSYGMVLLPEGKMKSREGTVVDADDLIEEVRLLAAEEIRKRDSSLSKEEVQSRALPIAVGAIKFYLLRVDPKKDIHFDPKESISFDGFTGPYCQYAYARCAGIVRNAVFDNHSDPDFSRLGNEEELQLIRTLMQFPEIVENAACGVNPSLLCTHLLTVAQAFNQFYNKHSVLSADDAVLTQARLALVKSTAQVLQNGLALFGIAVLEQM